MAEAGTGGVVVNSVAAAVGGQSPGVGYVVGANNFNTAGIADCV